MEVTRTVTIEAIALEDDNKDEEGSDGVVELTAIGTTDVALA